MTLVSVRLVELAPEDAAAAAAASGWLIRTGQPVAALRYIRIAYELGQPVNVATVLGSYEQLDEASQAAVADDNSTREKLGLTMMKRRLRRV